MDNRLIIRLSCGTTQEPEWMICAQPRSKILPAISVSDSAICETWSSFSCG